MRKTYWLAGFSYFIHPTEDDAIERGKLLAGIYDKPYRIYKHADGFVVAGDTHWTIFDAANDVTFHSTVNPNAAATS